jgi:ATP-dependent RNA helicase DDX55/SPB4
VIAPTRELANQISNVLAEFLKDIPTFTQLLFIGGMSIEEDLDNFQSKGGNILIATPGRLHDLLLRHEGFLLKSNIKHLVSDFGRSLKFVQVG